MRFISQYWRYQEDITFQSDSGTLYRTVGSVGGQNVPVPLINIGRFLWQPSELEHYRDVNARRGARQRRSGRQAVTSPGTNGFSSRPTHWNKSIPGYAAFASSRFTTSRSRMQRRSRQGVSWGNAESFYINSGKSSICLILNPLGPPDAKRTSRRQDITSFILEVPISCLTRDANSPVSCLDDLELAAGAHPAATANVRGAPTIEGGA